MARTKKEGAKQPKAQVQARLIDLMRKAPKAQPIQSANISKKSQTAKLELPEGYKPAASNMGRRGKGKGKMERAIAAAERDKDRARAGLPPLQLSPADRVSLSWPILGHGASSAMHLPWPSLGDTTFCRIWTH